MSTPEAFWMKSGQSEALSGVALAHGGAGPQDPQGNEFQLGLEILRQALSESLQAPESATKDLQSAWPKMTSAAQRAMRTVWAMESAPLLNAGQGASLQADGVARVSASFMESEHRLFSAVMNAEELEHACELAWWLQREKFSVLDARGAAELMGSLNIPRRSIITPERLNRWVNYKREAIASQASSAGRTGTVGSVVVDSKLQLAAVTSTGGVGNETPGRVGDSPTVAGNYCTNLVAISCTGIGEQIMAHALSPRIAFAVERGVSLELAMSDAFAAAFKMGYQFAAIAVARHPSKSNLVQWAAAASHCQILWQMRIPF